MQNMDLTELMEKSLAIPTGSIVCWPDQGCEQKLRPTTDEGVDSTIPTRCRKVLTKKWTQAKKYVCSVF